MTLLDENWRVLSARHPEASKALARLAAPPPSTAAQNPPGTAARVRVEHTASGQPTALLDGIYLHSRHDPRRDAAAQVQREIDPAATAIIVLGFGLGYGAEAARARFPDLPLLVVEPDAEVFHAALSCRELAGLLADPAVSLHVDDRPEGLPLLLEKLPLARPSFLRLRPALGKNPGAYRAAEEVVRSWLLRRDINVNTLNRFGRLWVRNLSRNLPAFAECPGVTALQGVFEGLPALVVAGGPSLDTVAPYLPQLSQRLIVVSVNTPLRACLAAGVEPDFTVAVDPQYWASRYLDWTESRHGVMVVEPSAHPRVFRRSARLFYLCSSLFPLGETLEAAVGEKGKLGAGGSVATSAWDLARLLGARPIYAAGLDLGFPSMRTHCRGVYGEDIWFAASGRLHPVEGSSFRALRDIGLFTVRSAAGGSTPTDRRMLLYKWWFENQLRMRPEVTSYALSPDGVAIEGMPLATIDEVLALPAVRPEIDRRMELLRRIRAEAASRQESRRRLQDVLGKLAGQLDELARLSRRGLQHARELGRILAKRGDPAACLASLDAVDRAILEIAARNIAGFLVQSIIHHIAGEGDRTVSAEEILARSEAIYEGIESSASWQRKLLQQAALFLAGEAGLFS